MSPFLIFSYKYIFSGRVLNSFGILIQSYIHLLNLSYALYNCYTTNVNFDDLI